MLEVISNTSSTGVSAFSTIERKAFFTLSDALSNFGILNFS